MKKMIFISMLVLILILPFNWMLNAQEKTKEEKQAEKLAKLESSLEEILGGNESWKPTVFKDLRLNMPCKDVAKFFKRLKCDPHKSYDFPTVNAGFGKVFQYNFTFKKGALQSATIVFATRLLDQKRFATAILNVTQRKYGALSPEKLSKSVIVWTNSDYDTVSLTFTKKRHWELKVKMPKHDSGNVISGNLDENTIRVELSKVLGSSKEWKIGSLGKFEFGMSYEQVKSIYPTMSACDPSKDWCYGDVTIGKHPLVHILQFCFKQGQLQNAKLIFHRQLPQTIFKKVSTDLMEAKWGKVDPSKRERDILTIYKSGYGVVQRTFSMDHWEIKQDFKK